MINYKCLKKVGPCIIVATGIEKDGNMYQVRICVKRRAYSNIKRTRKRQLQQAKFMDHTSYEWSQYWHSKARKLKRWRKKNE